MTNSRLVTQTGFAGGEIGPLAWGKQDAPAYQHGLRTALNFIPTLEGPILNRPGTRYVCAVKDSTYAPLLREFIFADGQNFLLEIGDHYVRFVQAGAQVHWNSAAAWDGALTYALANPVTYGGQSWLSLQDANTGNVPSALSVWWAVDTTTPLEVVTPWAIADVGRLVFSQVGDIITVTHPSYSPYEIARLSNVSWTVTAISYTPQAYFGGQPRIANVPAMLFSVAGYGGLAAPANLSSAVGSQLWSAFSVYKIGDFVLQLEVNDFGGHGAGYHLYQSTKDGNSASAPVSFNGNPDWYDWTYQLSSPGTYYQGNYAWDVVTQKVYICQGDAITSNPPATPWVAACDDTRPAKLWQFVVTQLYQDELGVTHETLGSTPTQAIQFARYTDRPLTLVWGPETGGPASYVILGCNVYAGRNGIWGLLGSVPPRGIYSYGTFKDDGAPPDYSQQPPRGTNPFDYATGSGTKTQSFPGANTNHEQRAVYARSDRKPQDFWGSKLGQSKNFDVNTPVVDTDSYNFKPASERLEEIRWLLSLRYLLIGTGNGIWGAYGQNGAVTPSSIHLRNYSRKGTSYLHPVAFEHSALYQSTRGRIMDLQWDFRSDAYIGRDVSVIARHLFEGHTLTGWAYAETPYSVVWAIRNDGVLLSLTYSPAGIEAWARHTTQGTFERVATVVEVDSSTGVSVDAVYVVVARVVNGFTVRYIERFVSRIVPQIQVVAADLTSTFTPDVRQANFLDCSLKYDGHAPTSSVTFAGASYAGGDQVTATAAANFIGATPRGFAAGDIGSSLVINPDSASPIEATIVGVTSALIATVLLDAALPAAYQNTPLTGVAFAPNSFSGLGHLEGLSVNALLDGAVAGPFTVTAGAITLGVGATAVVAQVGLAYNSDLELLDLAAAQVKANVKSVVKTWFQIVGSRGIQAGETFDGTLFSPQLQEVAGGPTVPGLTTALVGVPVASTWNTGCRACLRQSDPLPLTITAISREMVVGGRG